MRYLFCKIGDTTIIAYFLDLHYSLLKLIKKFTRIMQLSSKK
jgi:hypothetical protein